MDEQQHPSGILVTLFTLQSIYAQNYDEKLEFEYESENMNLADVCRYYELLLMNFVTGCIFEYNDAYPEESGIGFKKEHSPNFTGSFYSKKKNMFSPRLFIIHLNIIYSVYSYCE